MTIYHVVNTDASETEATLTEQEWIRYRRRRCPRWLVLVGMVLATLVALAIIGGWKSTLDLNPPAPSSSTTLEGRIDEDESGWNCKTMGNKVCGPIDRV